MKPQWFEYIPSENIGYHIIWPRARYLIFAATHLSWDQCLDGASTQKSVIHYDNYGKRHPKSLFGKVWKNNHNTAMVIRVDFRFAPSQWETSLQSNAVSHWLDANLKSALVMIRSRKDLSVWVGVPTFTVTPGSQNMAPAITENRL